MSLFFNTNSAASKINYLLNLIGIGFCIFECNKVIPFGNFFRKCQSSLMQDFNLGNKSVKIFFKREKQFIQSRTKRPNSVNQ